MHPYRSAKLDRARTHSRCERENDNPALPRLEDAPELHLIDIHRIVAYEHHPRRVANPAHSRIKASVRRSGLKHPLTVTQRPGDTDYLLWAGGATRLRVLKELFAETGNVRYAKAPCLFRSWRRESDVLLAHLEENDLRGPLSFIDKAVSISRAKSLLESETGAGELDAGRLADHLAERGFRIGPGLVPHMLYAAERLLPLLPQALNAGMNRREVAHILALDKAARALWLERCIGTEAEYETVFAALCSRYDGTEWDCAQLRRALDAEVAERGECSIHESHLELESRLR